jgi:hypothetical protein
MGSLFKRRISRRQFFATSAVAAGGFGLAVAGEEAIQIGSEALDIHRTWRAASQNNDDFLAEKSGSFYNVRLGFSFAPEQWAPDEIASGEALAGLAFASEELGLKAARLGLRWNRVSPDGRRESLDFYRPYLNYGFEHGLDLALNVGPIRTFRWPEEHVPEGVLGQIGIPHRETRVELNSPLARVSLEYLDRLLDLLSDSYGGEMGRIAAIQPENEAFWPFGIYRWTMSRPYLSEVFDLIHARYPQAPLLLSSAGRLNLREITSFFRELIERDESYHGRLISGFDYHYKTPANDPYPVLRNFDPIALALKWPPAPSCGENIADSRRYGFRIEVTEGEAEPTGTIMTPGNSAKEFRYMLLRCAENVLDRRTPSVLRIWGIEHLARVVRSGNATGEHTQIVDLIRRLNEQADGATAQVK